MARGNSPVTDVTTREQRTDALLAQLAETVSESGREAITAELVELNLGLCDALAHRYVNRGADRDDLVQVARMALFMAVGRFRPEAPRSPQGTCPCRARPPRSSACSDRPDTR